MEDQSEHFDALMLLINGNEFDSWCKYTADLINARGIPSIFDLWISTYFYTFSLAVFVSVRSNFLTTRADRFRLRKSV